MDESCANEHSSISFISSLPIQTIPLSDFYIYNFILRLWTTAKRWDEEIRKTDARVPILSFIS